MAAASFALAVRELARTGGGVATVGRIDADPGISTAVARTAVLMLDQRHTDPETLGSLHAEASAIADRIAAEENVRVSWTPIFRMAPLAFDEELVAQAASVVAGLQGEAVRLPSGPLHDAVHIAGTGVPTAMLFVRSKRGLSHTNEEDTDVADLELGLRALEQLVAAITSGHQSKAVPSGLATQP
jgi:N-carbamoyl-L-amino-acid hydrolase